MARKLPWLSDSKSKRCTAKEESPPPKRRRVRASSDDADSAATTRDKGKNRSGTERNPSSSPPPAPPTPEFMKEGFDQDDMWVMVEDEFLETAQQFTRHLHHAEYQRLKRLAEENKAAGQDDIVRPVDGKSVLSVAGQKRAESERLRRKQRKALREVVADKQDGEHWEDDAWASNPRLAGLMARSVPTNLAKLVDSQSQTQISESQPTEKPPRVEECLSSPPPDLGSSPPPVIRKSKSVLSSRCPTTDFAPPKANSRLKSAGRQNQTGSGRQKQEEEKRRSVKLDEIPTFLV